MSEKLKLFSSESVSEGHPDKVADQISDAILDACLAIDPNARVACETFVTTNFVLIGGEITCKEIPNIEQIARDVIRSVGYTKSEYLFSDKDAEVVVKVHTQSPDIAQGVDSLTDEEVGAGDQGIMFGYATNESEGYMPLPISISDKLVRYATKLRKEGKFTSARPDMKSQVTIDYTSSTPKVRTVLMSVQHDPDFDEKSFKEYIKNEIMIPVVKSFGLSTDFEVLINPTGRFVLGGPAGDTGLTGRKIIVDTYGGSARHGGGAFSGKDPTKVDRSASYMARYITKNLVAAGVADRLEVQLGYAIGCPKPVSISVETFGTNKVPHEQILEIIDQVFDCRPGMIIKNFSLRKPVFKYRDISNYGHFGRPDLDLPWEKLDKIEEIKNLLK